MADVSVGSDVDAEAVIEVVERIEEDTHPVAPLDNYIDMSLIQTTVPDPLRLRGIGGTTVWVLTLYLKHHLLMCSFCVCIALELAVDLTTNTLHSSMGKYVALPYIWHSCVCIVWCYNLYTMYNVILHNCPVILRVWFLCNA